MENRPHRPEREQEGRGAGAELVAGPTMGERELKGFSKGARGVREDKPGSRGCRGCGPTSCLLSGAQEETRGKSGDRVNIRTGHL